MSEMEEKFYAAREFDMPHHLIWVFRIEVRERRGLISPLV